MDLEEARTFVATNTVRATNGSRCVDDRYLPEQARGLAAFPAGDHEEAAGHTDNHADRNAVDPDTQQTSSHVGCGHMANAANPMYAHIYGVDTPAAEEIIRYAKERSKQDSRIKWVRLEGGHDVKAVFVIDSDEFTVNPYNPEAPKPHRAFIYDRKRHSSLLRRHAERLKTMRVKVAGEELIQVSQEQTDATLKILANGRPIYGVEFFREGDNVRSVVTRLGVVSG